MMGDFCKRKEDNAKELVGADIQEIAQMPSQRSFE
jgi:hypothetical protein